MRTRLDEIVENENGGRIQRTAEERTAICLKIAERAFRHGVEQAFNVPYFYNPEEVKPAPAKEEECRRTVRSAKEAAAYMEAGLCPRCASRHPDRRRGQRRSGCEWVHGSIYTRRLHHDGVEWMTWADERRSGKERRSKLNP